MKTLSIDRVVDLTDPLRNLIYGMTLDEARAGLLRVIRRPFAASTASSPSSPLTARRCRMARSISRPLRFFIAKRVDGPVSGRRRSHRRHPPASSRNKAWLISSTPATRAWCRPITSRRWPWSAVPIPTRLCADSSIRRATPCPPTSTPSGRLYRRAVRRDRQMAATAHPNGPVGVCFSGGIDSGVGFPGRPITRCCGSA